MPGPSLEPMTRPRPLFALRLASLVALGASVAGVIDHLRPQPAFCTVGSACDKIKQLGYGAVAGVPVAALGVGCFLALFCVSLAPGPAARRLTVAGGLVGGAIALALLALQIALVGSFCRVCLTVDVAALVAGASAALLARSPEARVEAWPPSSWAGLLAAALGVPWGVAELRPAAPVPAAVQALFSPDAIDIVEFSDFECPFCRLAHPALDAAVRAATRAGHPIRLVRKTLPLPSHPHARDASLAWVCASSRGKGDAMADLLFSQADLSREAIAAAAASVGLEADALAGCLADPATARAVDADVALVRGADFKGLPTVWVEGERLLGARPQADYDAAIARAAAGSSQSMRPWPLAAALALSAALFFWGRRASQPA